MEQMLEPLTRSLKIMLMGRVVPFAKVVLLTWNAFGPATAEPFT
jgi:hypothetical protein